MLPNTSKMLFSIFISGIFSFKRASHLINRSWNYKHGEERKYKFDDKKKSFVLLSRLCKSVSPSNNYGLVFISPSQKNTNQMLCEEFVLFSLSYLHRVTYTIYGETFNLFMHLNASTLSLIETREQSEGMNRTIIKLPLYRVVQITCSIW